ncbi:hypothetical protein BCV72DRAFT_204637, partial [Rhizopus microsporus var. microsporus]
AQFLFRTSSLPGDSLLTKLLPYIQSQRISKWPQLYKSPLWTSISNEYLEAMSHNNFIRKRRQFLIDHRSKLQEKHSKLLSHCYNDLTVDTILRIPVTRSEQSRFVRWRPGWLPLGKPQACPFHPIEFSHQHSFSCLDMHNRLQIPKSIDDPLSYLLNLLLPAPLTKKARKSIDAWLTR